MQKEKHLKNRRHISTDDTASIRYLVLWEDDIKKVTSGQSYQLIKVWLRLYNDAPYVTLNKQSTINPAQLKITRSDDQEVKSEHDLKTVLLPADGVQSITRYLSCNSCKTRIEEKDKKVLKCAQCGLSQLKQKCCTRIYAKTIFKTDKEPMMTNLKHNISWTTRKTQKSLNNLLMRKSKNLFLKQKLYYYITAKTILSTSNRNRNNKKVLKCRTCCRCIFFFFSFKQKKHYCCCHIFQLLKRNN